MDREEERQAIKRLLAREDSEKKLIVEILNDFSDCVEGAPFLSFETKQFLSGVIMGLALKYDVEVDPSVRERETAKKILQELYDITFEMKDPYGDSDEQKEVIDRAEILHTAKLYGVELEE